MSMTRSWNGAKGGDSELESHARLQRPRSTDPVNLGFPLMPLS